jgi:hypothetical protein
MGVCAGRIVEWPSSNDLKGASQIDVSKSGRVNSTEQIRRTDAAAMIGQLSTPRCPNLPLHQPYTESFLQGGLAVLHHRKSGDLLTQITEGENDRAYLVHFKHVLPT